MKYISINGNDYEILQLLGKGKSGYSYLVTHGGAQYVVKQIHHEPCDYYQFGDKLQSEILAYTKLINLGINLPKLLDVDEQNERILKEFIEGNTIQQLIQNNSMKPTYLEDIQSMSKLLCANNINIDYYPTNFVVCKNNKLWYVDYEYNDYMVEWDFDHWGKKYWIIEAVQ